MKTRKAATHGQIAVLVTGGTIDGAYDALKGRLCYNLTHIPAMLERGRARIPARIEVLMLKESLDLTAADRQTIADACRQAGEQRIVLTHGTDTMVQTACFLAEALSGKTVVLTGAMIPYQVRGSDALFNLGSALAFAQVLPPGIYVAMHGQCFPWNAVTKNRERGVFERSQTPSQTSPAHSA